MYAGRVQHPVFVALEGTVRKYDLPKQLFDDLISAFEQDQRVTRYRNWDELFDYCRYSANPVGRLVLRLCGYAMPSATACPTPPAPRCSSRISGRT